MEVADSHYTLIQLLYDGSSARRDDWLRGLRVRELAVPALLETDGGCVEIEKNRENDEGSYKDEREHRPEKQLRLDALR